VVLAAASVYGAFVHLTDPYIDSRYGGIPASEADFAHLPQPLAVGLSLREDRFANGSAANVSLAMQLARNCSYPPLSMLKRELLEVLVARRLRQRHSEHELMSLYAHTVFLGHSGSNTVIGFESAARTYLNKSLSSITTGEAAWLAILPSRPNFYLNHPDRAREVRNELLSEMAKKKLIDASDAALAEAEPVPSAPSARRR